MMRRACIAGWGAISVSLLLLWTAPSLAQDGHPAQKAPPGRGEPTAPFVDRDGDGIHDQMKNRFRRHKRMKDKRHGEDKGREARQAQRGEPAD
jgi:hypothetical protein